MKQLLLGAQFYLKMEQAVFHTTTKLEKHDVFEKGELLLALSVPALWARGKSKEAAFRAVMRSCYYSPTSVNNVCIESLPATD